MKGKKKTAKRAVSQSPLNPEQEDLIDALFREVGITAPEDTLRKVPDALIAQSLIERLPSDESVIPLLLVLKKGFKAKNVTKAIKRALFKLSRKGIPTERFYAEEKRPPVLKPLQKDPPQCYVGPVNGAGTRAVVVILHRGGKGLDIGFGVISDTEGFLEFFFRTVSRKDAKKLKDQFAAEAGPFVETSLAHAATILEAAYQRQQAAKSSAPADYLELRPWLLDTTPLLERPAIYDLIPETVTSKHILTDSNVKALFENPLMETWLIEFDSLRPFMEDMFKVNESPIVLTEGQKAGRVREIQEKCMAEIFTVEERERLQHRLEEMGYVLFRLGQEDAAGVALAGAHSVIQEASLLKTDPIVETLLARSISIYTKAMENGGGEKTLEKGSASPIIVS